MKDIRTNFIEVLTELSTFAHDEKIECVFLDNYIAHFRTEKINPRLFEFAKKFKPFGLVANKTTEKSLKVIIAANCKFEIAQIWKDYMELHSLLQQIKNDGNIKFSFVPCFVPIIAFAVKDDENSRDLFVTFLTYMSRNGYLTNKQIGYELGDKTTMLYDTPYNIAFKKILKPYFDEIIDK